jgi:hypothetical protein
MKQLFFITILFLSINAKSQTYKEQIIGNWKVENATIKSDNKNIKDFAQSFKNSLFSFKVNQDFIFTSTEKNQLIDMLKQHLKNTKWVFDERAEVYKIGTKQDHYNIMILIAKIEGNKAHFSIKESDINLELVKI